MKSDTSNGTVSREEYNELKSLVEALQRRVSSQKSEIQTLQNKVEHREKSGDGYWHGAKADVVEQLSVGQRVTPSKLGMMQTGINPKQKKSNTQALLESDWFERDGGAEWRFVGNPDAE